MPRTALELWKRLGQIWSRENASDCVGVVKMSQTDLDRYDRKEDVVWKVGIRAVQPWKPL